MTRKILVIGGTGMLGKPVANRLKQDGFEVTVFTRNPEEARIKMPASFAFAKGRVEHIESLKQAMQGMYGVHINLQGGPTMNSFDKVEHLGTQNVVNAALSAGVKKITFISGTSVNEKNSWFPVIRAKLKAEETIRASGIDYTIFRPSWFYESLPLFIRNGRAMVIGKNPNQYHWLSASDYAEMVSKAYSTESGKNITLKVYGPEKYTIEEALDSYCEIMHPEIKKTRMSVGLMRFLGAITFNSQLKFFSQFTRYFEGVSENGKSENANAPLGRPKTTLYQWASNNLN